MENSPRNRGFLFAASVLTQFSLSETPAAAGFAVYEQSVSGLGTAFAGSSAGSGDISTIFYNPAGLARLSGTELIAGLHVIMPTARFNSEGSSDLLGQPLTGGDGGNAGGHVLIPNLYFASDLNVNIRFGVGVNSPFGLATQYDRDWKGRYEAIKSELGTVNINPTLAFSLNDALSVGLGVSAQYLKVDLTNAIDFGTICVAQQGPTNCANLGLAPQTADGMFKISGDNWGWGYNIGVIYQFLPSTRLGFTYRSKVSHTIKGKAQFDVPHAAQPLTSKGAFTRTRFRTKADLPETVSTGIFHKVNAKWAIMGDLTWTRWSRLKVLTVEFDNPIQPPNAQDFDWKNTLRLSIGLNYQPSSTWTLRTGIAYDESPVRDTEHREFRIPDDDRYWVSWGIGYRATPQLQLNFAYAYLFVDDPKVNHGDDFGHSLKGRYDADIDIVSAEMRWMF